MAFDYLKARKSWAINDAKRDKGLKTPKNIKRFDNLNYGKDYISLLDIYRPKDNDEYLPVIISIHGGGWFYGDKKLYQYYTMDLALRGFVVVNFTYHLAPEYKYPKPLEDIKDLFDYLVSIKDDYKLDLNNVFIVGDSAGAQLNYQLNLILSNDKYQNLFEFKFNKGLNIKGIALNCGCYSFMTKPLGPLSMIKLYLGKDYKKYNKTYDMSKYITSSFPPTYLMTGYGDFLKILSKPLYRKLKRNNVKIIYELYGSKKQKDKTGHVFHLDMNNEIGRKCNDDECNFFKSLIK